MCLYIHTTNPETLFKGRKEITCYKVLTKEREAIFYRVKYPLVGIVKSNRKDKYLTDVEHQSEEVNRGIHVYTSLRRAKRYSNSCYYRNRRLILPVICKIEDFVAADEDEQAVFTKVRVHKRARDLKGNAKSAD